MNSKNFINVTKLKKALDFLLFTLPVLVLILITSEIPFIMNLIYSFTKWNGISRTLEFIGIDNFIEIFTDDEGLIQAFIFTFKYSILFIICVNIFALFLAIMLDNKIKSRDALRAVFFIPNILSLVIVGFMWKFVFTRGFEALYELLGLEFFQYSWLGDPNLAFISVVIVSLWQSVGFYMVIYIAGLQSIPKDVIEASMIDGANRSQRFFKVTVPLLMPSFTVTIFLSLANALKVFDIIYTLTNGGPGGRTISVSLDIYREAFINSRYGYGTAKSLVFFVVIIFVTIIQVSVFKKWEVEA